MTLTKQQIIALAVEAGAIPASDGEYFPSELVICESMFETFAMAAYQRGVRDEREACAKARAGRPRELTPVGTGALLGEQQYCFDKGWKEGAAAVRAAIRARSAETKD